MSLAKLAVGSLGIYTAYLTISILNEKMYVPFQARFTHQYRSIDGKRFHLFEHAEVSVAVNALCSVAYAMLSSIVRREPSNSIPFAERIWLGVLYTINVVTINFSLYYIPYPVRVVGDKLGYFTAVIVAVFFTRLPKKSNLSLGKGKIIIAVMITIGILLFFTNYHIKKSNIKLYDPDQKWIGYLLLAISVTAEAFFGDSQAYVKATFQPTINHLMISVNSLTLLFTIVKLGVNGQVGEAWRFVTQHDEIGRDLVMMGVLSVIGQISIYYVVLNFKQHMFPLISTVRKVFTVLLSIYIYNHKMNIYQWIALVLVFGGMIYQLADELYYDITGERKLKMKRDAIGKD